MNKNFKFITAALSLILCFTAIGFGQKTTGNIEGTVTDPNGAVVAGATITIKASGSTSGLSATTTSRDDGSFQFSQIAPGSYTMTSTATNFKTSRQEVQVTVDKTSNITSKLEVGAGEVIVEVTNDSAVSIDINNTKVDTTLTRRIIEDLPAGVTFSSLLKVAPNVRPEAQTQGFQIDGASGAENVFIIDGQEVTNFRTGNLDNNFNIPFDLIQEVQIKSTGYEAEYGGATGGIINVVTSGGNDQWRGSFGTSFRPSKFQGNRREQLGSFNVGGVANTTGATTYFQPPTDGGTAFFPTASVSGPIAKGKLWFSASYAPQITETSRNITYFVSSDPGSSALNPATRVIAPAGTVKYKNSVRQENMFVRLDAQPLKRLRLFGTFLYNPTIQDGTLPGTQDGLAGAPTSVNFGGTKGILAGPDLFQQQGGRQNANAFNSGATWNPTNWAILNFRFGRSFQNEKLESYGLARQTRVICSQVSGPATAALTGCNQGFASLSNNSQINYDVSTRTTFDADASFVGVEAAGRHNFKFGYQLNRLFNTVDRGYARLGIIQLFYGRLVNALDGGATPSGPLCPTAPLPPTPGCVLGSGLMTRFGTVGEASSDNHGLFAQDSWQVNSRLTLNLGVRIENETVPSFGPAATSQAIKFGWGDKISPRIGGAFDLTGDGKTKLLANYGWFYDRFKYELPRGSFGGDFFRRDFFDITPGRGYNYLGYTFANILGNTPDILGGQCPIVGGTGYSVCQRDFRIATNIAGADIFESGGIDPNIKAARQSEYTFGLERSLGQNFVLAGRYTHKNVDHAIEDVGVFNAQGSEAYIIGNPGEGLVCEISTQGRYPCTKAIRKYDAVEVRLDKRATNYFFNANYTWSRLFGNYSGLASTDEVRSSPNVNRFFDLPPLGFTADGDPDDGRLATDRPHVFKAYGGYTFDWKGNGVNRTGINGFTTIQSGTPLTTIYNLYSLGSTILNGRGDLGRTEMFTETDLGVNHRYKFGRDNRFTLEGFVDIRNLFNEKNVTGVQNNISNQNFSGATLSTPQAGCTTCAGANAELSTFQTIFNGVGIRQFVVNFIDSPVTAQASRRLNTYGQANAFQGPRDVRFGFRFFF